MYSSTNKTDFVKINKKQNSLLYIFTMNQC